MQKSTADRLRCFYSRFQHDDQVLILINADPDAIAAAMAVKRLLWRKVAGITLACINVIKRPDNLAMVRLLRLNLSHVKDIAPERFKRFVIVDSQPGHNEAFGAFTYDVLIDHHPDLGVKAAFTDIRPKYGATATIMTEYLRAAHIKPSASLASALFYAIKTDTHNFERKSQIEDVRAFQFLYRHANHHMARKFEQADLRLDFLKYFKIALAEMCMRRTRIFVHLGQVASPDVCVLIAEFFMRVSSVTWSIVSGQCDNLVVIIFRNDGLKKNAGEVAKNGFSQMGSAGGHKSMARAEIPVEKLSRHVDTEDKKAVMQWIIQQMENNTGKKTGRKFTRKAVGLGQDKN